VPAWSGGTAGGGGACQPGVAPTLLQRERARLLRHLEGGASAHHVVGAARALGELGARCALAVDGSVLRGLCGAMLRKVSAAPRSVPLYSSADHLFCTRVLLLNYTT